MDILSAKKSYLGVDLGTSAVKMVELQDKGGRALLLTYGYVEQPTDIIRSSSREMESKIVNIIKDIHKKSHMTSKRVVAALPSFSVFSSIISLPAMKKKDLAKAIQWEAKKFIPLPIEEMTLDWKIVPPKPVMPVINALPKKKDDATNKGEKKGEQNEPQSFLTKILDTKKAVPGNPSLKNNIKVLLTAAPKKIVERYIRIFRTAEMELVSLETEAFALERSLAGNDPAPIMVIDIGAVSSNISIIESSIPILTRSIDVGGVSITKAIMTSLNVDLERAEQFKRDIGFSADGPGGLPDTVKSAINPIINEVKYSVDIYLSQSGTQNKIEKIILFLIDVVMSFPN
ncbi:MAG TPA: pilus assembly protein PilM, partial [Patescibacteria group bacterium]|nr:pilus assembly protein PilM [Patescibacteria group bacterium]